ncbi:MAG TPA: hypothetical protein VGM06_10695 [Polyangiaceae bacterium]
MTPPHRRTLLRAAVAAAVAFSLYEVGFNVFLMSGALSRLISADPDVVLVTYDRGWSLVPGYVHARGLRIRSKDSNVEFDLHIDRCMFRFAPTALLHRNFHVYWVTGDGVTFRARQRQDPRDATAKKIAELPPIEGLEPVPLRGAPRPPPDDAHYNLFTVELENVDARSTREIWVNELHFTGDARETGAFYLRPMRWAWIGPATAELHSGQLAVGDQTWAKPLAGVLEVTIRGFDPRVAEGKDVLRGTSAHVDVHASLPGLAFVRRALEDSAWRVRDGEGEALLDLHVADGRLASPSKLEINAARTVLEDHDLTLEGAVHVSATISDAEGGDRLDAVVGVTRAAATLRTAPGAALRADHAEATFSSSHLDLVDRPLADPSASVHVPSVDIPDARIANAMWPPGSAVQVEAGGGTLGGEVDLADGVAHGGVLLAIDHLRLRLGSTALTSNLRAHAVLREGHMDAGTFDWSGSRIDLNDVEANGSEPDWWGTVALTSGVLVVAPPRVSLRAHVEAKARDTGPMLGVAVADAGVPGWAAKVLSAPNFRASGDVRASAGSILVRDLVATAGSLRLDGALHRSGARDDLLFLVDAPVITVGVEKDHDGTHVQLLGARDWYNARLADHFKAAPP